MPCSSNLGSGGKDLQKNDGETEDVSRFHPTTKDAWRRTGNVQYFTLNKVKMTQETRHLGQHVIYNLNCWV